MYQVQDICVLLSLRSLSLSLSLSNVRLNARYRSNLVRRRNSPTLSCSTIFLSWLRFATPDLVKIQSRLWFPPFDVSSRSKL